MLEAANHSIRRSEHQRLKPLSTQAADRETNPSLEAALAQLRCLALTRESGDHPSLDDVVESIIAWAQAAFGTAAIVAAQEQFFANMGKVFTDDSFYDARISYFFDWFLLERSITTDNVTPYAIAAQQLSQHNIITTPENKYWLDGLGQYRHSLFEIAKVQDTSMVLVDLLQGQKLTVKARKGQESFCALDKKALFQGFVYQFADINHLSHGFVLHPAKVAPILKKHIKVAKKSADFSAYRELCHYASLQLRYLRHRHVEARTIYQAGLKPGRP